MGKETFRGSRETDPGQKIQVPASLDSAIATKSADDDDPRQRRLEHSRPQSSSLLRMTDGEKSSGELSPKVCSDWFMIETIKPSLIGQFLTRNIVRYIRNLQCVQGTEKEMDETPKKLCNRKVKICRCCNSHLSNVYDSIDFFGKTAQRENVIEKLKEVGKIEVQESDQDFLTTKICRKCFRKVTGLWKAMDDFRSICSQSKEIQISDLNNARLKRGRKPSTPGQEPHGKRKLTIPTEFTTRHFETNTLTPADQAAHEEYSSELGVQISSLFSCEQLPARDILPLPAVSEENASSIDEEFNKPQASEILMDAGL